MPLETFNDISTDFKLPYYLYSDTTTATTGSAFTPQYKYWTVNSPGVVIMSCFGYSSNSNDIGTCNVEFVRNGVVVANDYSRLVTSDTLVNADSCMIALKVNTGDKLRAYQSGYKSGVKTFIWHVLCLGCTITETNS